MFKPFAPHAKDFYKAGHFNQYPPGTDFVYSNFTPRSAKNASVLPDFDGKVVFFGLQGTLRELNDLWQESFFKRPKDWALARYKQRMDGALGKGAITVDHLAALHDLKYLPLRFKALPEGSRVNLRVPLFTHCNTKPETRPEFFWLTNLIETQLSAEQWGPITSATTAYEYARLARRYAKLTGAPLEFVPWQGHDFSARGMMGIAAGAKSGAGHLTSFLGTDTVLALDYIDDYYFGQDTYLGGSVPATEHSVMCMGGEEGELQLLRRLLCDVYPSGVVSIVSDTWDFWRLLTEYVPQLKAEILARAPNEIGLAKAVFRPDSGDPVKILCGSALEIPALEGVEVYRALEAGYRYVRPPSGDFYEAWFEGFGNLNCSWKQVDPEPHMKGAVECLWEIFGGSFTATGHRMLHERVGLIYGDSINLIRAGQIFERLHRKKFASNSVVFGIGSYTYQCVTRDSFGTAIKATFGSIHGQGRSLFKAPKTDDGVKNSARGLLRVEYEDDNFVLYENQTPEQERQGLLRTTFEDGEFFNQETIAQIRDRLAAGGAP